ncbi:MAG: MerR family transcriptional regulator [Verrucomicrobiales bacterium]|nr:MerR family transcriptional regulator [Verrucomicrobiota bacterium JB025]
MTTSYSIRTVSEKTGLSPHVIRAWERRYQAIEPRRSEGKHRIYTDSEIERLNLLHGAIENGHSIGHVAKLANDDLLKLQATEPRPARSAPNPPAGQQFQDEAFAAINDFDLPALDDSLRRATLTLGHQGLLRHVIAPTATAVGEMWRQGEITVAQEHFFTSAVKAFLKEIARQYAPHESAPTLIICTPVGQLHELGAVIAAAAAANAGWNTIYLGPGLPAHEIAGAAIRNDATAVALSIVYPEDDPKLPQELENIVQLLPPRTSLIVGGRAAAAYQNVLEHIGAIVPADLKDFDARLDTLRHHAPQPEDQPPRSR